MGARAGAVQWCACMCAVSILRLAGEAEGAAQKGESRVRAFGGVPTFPVVKRVLAVLGRFFARERGRLNLHATCDFLSIFGHSER